MRPRLAWYVDVDMPAVQGKSPMETGPWLRAASMVAVSAGR